MLYMTCIRILMETGNLMRFLLSTNVVTWCFIKYFSDATDVQG